MKAQQGTGVFEKAIVEFGRRLGMRSLSAGGEPLVELFFGSLGRLRLEEAGDWALVGLVRALPAHAAAAERLSDACDARHRHPRDIHPALAGEEAVLTVRVPMEEFSASAIEELIDRLAAILDGVERALQPEKKD